MTLKFNMDTKEFKKSLEKHGVKVAKAMVGALFQSGELIIGTAKKRNLIPVNFGVLRASGHVQKPTFTKTQIVVRFGFGGPAGIGNQGETNKEEVGYALYIHENPRAGKTGGVSPSGKKYARTKGGKAQWSTIGGWKYLTKAVKMSRKQVRDHLARAYNKAV